MALLAQHLVELRAPVAAHELDAATGMVRRKRAEKQEEALIEPVLVPRRPVGHELVEALLRRRQRVERHAFAGVNLVERREERHAEGLVDVRTLLRRPSLAVD